MARNSFQKGCLFTRGKKRKVWVARWREPVLGPNGTIACIQRSTVLGPVSVIPRRREAQTILDEKLKALNRGMYMPETTLTFGEFCSTWEETALPLFRESTSRFYKDVLRRWVLPSFCDKPLREIRPLDVQNFINQFAPMYSGSVLKHLRATMSRVMGTAVEWEYIPKNPALGVKIPRGRAVHRATVLPPGDISRIVGQLREPYKTIVTLIAPTGMRESEVLALSWEDIDFDRAIIHVRRSYYRGKLDRRKQVGASVQFT